MSDQPSDTVAFDINSLTYREAIDLEKVAGIPITDIGKEGIPMMGLAAGFGWILARRDTPGLTFDEFIDRTVDLGSAFQIEASTATPTSGDESKPSA